MQADAYEKFKFDEAVMIAGNEAERRSREEIEARYEMERQQRDQGQGINQLLGQSGTRRDPRLGTNTNQRSAGLAPQSDGANIWSTDKGIMVAGTVPFIGKQ